MNELDQQSKQFFDVNTRFADLLNGSLYQGEQVLNASELEEMNTEASQKRRDMIKRCKKDGTVYAVYGTEFQSTVDRRMPLRIMEYDVLTYLRMMNVQDCIFPLSTVCLFTGKEEWKGPKTLHEMMKIPEELKPIVQNYEARIIHALKVDVNHFKDAEVREFFELFQDIHRMNKEELYQKYSVRGLHSAAAVETAAVLGRCNELRQMVIETKEGIKVCENFSRIVREWKDEGRIEGKIEEKKSVIQNMLRLGLELEQIACVVALDEEEVSRMIQELSPVMN